MATSLHHRLKKDEAFQKSNQLDKSAKALVHYTADKEYVLCLQTLPYGDGPVLSHMIEERIEKALGFCAGNIYLQFDKKGSEIMFGINWFYGWTFTIRTGHKPGDETSAKDAGHRSGQSS